MVGPVKARVEPSATQPLETYDVEEGDAAVVEVAGVLETGLVLGDEVAAVLETGFVLEEALVTDAFVDDTDPTA